MNFLLSFFLLSFPPPKCKSHFLLSGRAPSRHPTRSALRFTIKLSFRFLIVITPRLCAALDTDTLGQVLLAPLPGKSCLCSGHDLLALLDVPGQAASISSSIEGAQAQMARLDPSIGTMTSTPAPRTHSQPEAKGPAKVHLDSQGNVLMVGRACLCANTDLSAAALDAASSITALLARLSAAQRQLAALQRAVSAPTAAPPPTATARPLTTGAKRKTGSIGVDADGNVALEPLASKSCLCNLVDVLDALLAAQEALQRANEDASALQDGVTQLLPFFTTTSTTTTLTGACGPGLVACPVAQRCVPNNCLTGLIYTHALTLRSIHDRSKHHVPCHFDCHGRYR